MTDNHWEALARTIERINADGNCDDAAWPSSRLTLTPPPAPKAEDYQKLAAMCQAFGDALERLKHH